MARELFGLGENSVEKSKDFFQRLLRSDGYTFKSQVHKPFCMTQVSKDYLQDHVDSVLAVIAYLQNHYDHLISNPFELRCAAYLHDIGKLISHHQHSIWSLDITKNEFRSLSPNLEKMIARHGLSNDHTGNRQLIIFQYVDKISYQNSQRYSAEHERTPFFVQKKREKKYNQLIQLLTRHPNLGLPNQLP